MYSQCSVDFSGGKKRDSERTGFLMKTAKLRESRAQDRLRTNSAIVIQKNVRRFVSYVKIRTAWGDDFDSRLSDIWKLEGVLSLHGQSFATPLGNNFEENCFDFSHIHITTYSCSKPLTHRRDHAASETHGVLVPGYRQSPRTIGGHRTHYFQESQR